MTDRELLALIRALSRLGGPLANAVSPALGQGLGAVGGGLGLASGIAGGNIPQAIGGAASLGANAANLAGAANLANGLGSVGGPLALGTSLANGNWGGAIGALPATVGAAANLGSSLGLLAPQLASAITAPLSALALPALFISIAATAEQNGGQDMFDSLFGGAKSQAEKQVEEHRDYAQRFPSLVEDRAKGASLLDSLGSLGPNDLADAFAAATKGVRATDLSPAYSHLAQPPHQGKSNLAAKIPGVDLSAWEQIAPMLEGLNWAAFTGLKDRAYNAGLDVNAIAGDQDRQISLGKPSATLFVDPTTGVNTDQAPKGTAGYSSQAAYDLSNAIAGIGQQLGINWGARGNEQAGENQGYTLSDDQLGGYGFTPGNHAAAVLKYLSTLDPSVTSHQNWQMYKDKLGVTDDMLNAIPNYTITARDKPMNPLAATAFQVPDGGG